MTVLATVFVRCGVRLEAPSFLQCRAWGARGVRGFRQKNPRPPQEVPKEKLSRGPSVQLEEAGVEVGGQGWAVLLRPAAFTVAFSGAALGSCAVWQYENMRSAALKSRVQGMWGEVWGGQKKRGEWREQVREWWAAQGEAARLFWPLAGLNLLVWCCWRVPALQATMVKYFLANPYSRHNCLPLLLSTFSHHSVVHLAANMFVLHSFMDTGVHLLGREQFLGVYLSAGVTSSFFSMVYKVAARRSSHSLGASGAICAVLGMFATLLPQAQLQLIFLPGLTFSAATGLKAMMASDAAGCVLGWRFFDHAAHLSGLLLGVGWCYLGNPLVWERREGLVTAWHNIRDSNRRD